MSDKEFKLKRKVVEALNSLCEQDVFDIEENVNAINSFFDNLSSDENKGLVPLSKQKNLDDLVDEYGETTIFVTLVNKMLKDTK